jgi:hypothetical protein
MKTLLHSMIKVALAFVLLLGVAEAEEAVIIHFPLSNGHVGGKFDMNQMFTLESLLEAKISETEVGEFDGNEIGGGEGVLYMYGPNASQLYKTIKPIIESSSLLKGGIVRVRHGEPGSSETRYGL